MPEHRNGGAAAQRREKILGFVGAMGLDAFEGANSIGPGVGESHAPANRLRRRRLMDGHGVAGQCSFRATADASSSMPSTRIEVSSLIAPVSPKKGAPTLSVRRGKARARGSAWINLKGPKPNPQPWPGLVPGSRRAWRREPRFEVAQTPRADRGFLQGGLLGAAHALAFGRGICLDERREQPEIDVHRLE